MRLNDVRRRWKHPQCAQPRTIMFRVPSHYCYHGDGTHQATWPSRVLLPRLELTAGHLNHAPTPRSKTSVRVLKCLPKASREGASRKLASILNALVNKNDYTWWLRLLRFTAHCLRHPGRGGRGSSLATAINRQVREEINPQACNKPTVRRGFFPLSDPARFLAMRMGVSKAGRGWF